MNHRYFFLKYLNLIKKRIKNRLPCLRTVNNFTMMEFHPGIFSFPGDIFVLNSYDIHGTVVPGSGSKYHRKDQNVVPYSQQWRWFVMVLLQESLYFVTIKLIGKTGKKHTHVQNLFCNPSGQEIIHRFIDINV